MSEITVMTSGAFCAAFRKLIPRIEKLLGRKVVLAATSIGAGDQSIPARLRRGETTDIVIAADSVIRDLVKEKLILADSRRVLARSAIGMVVRSGTPRPDISSVSALKKTLLDATSVACSVSVSGRYVSTELFQRLDIANEMTGRTRRIKGERVAAAVARGEAELGFQQISELRDIPGLEFVGPLPPEAQRVSAFSAGIASKSADPDAARAVIRFLASPEAAAAVAGSGLEPVSEADPG